jgi:hypothetical protein
MESLLILCFKSCLKGENDREYYDVLELEEGKRCTPEDVKRQYKRLSLNLHPDKLAQRGIENTPETRQKFLKIKEAYEVLSDPKRKKIYDNIGELGLKIYENRASEINPVEFLKNFQRNGRYRLFIYFFILFIFACLLLLPVLFSLKADGSIRSSWTAIWSPMWIADFFILAMAMTVLFTPEIQSTNEEGETITVERIPLVERLSGFVLTVLFILLQVFILIKLDKDVNWSWFIVFIPWLLYEGLSALVAVPDAVKNIPSPTSEGSAHLQQPLSEEDGNNGEDELFTRKMEAELEYFKVTWKRFEARQLLTVHLLRFWLAIFLALKLDLNVTWDWGLVLLPMWVFFAFKVVIFFLVRRWAANELDGIDTLRIEAQLERDPANIARYQKGMQLSSLAYSSCFLQCTALFMALMLISRLDVSSFSVFLILLPVFVFLGCCCCAICCGVMCLANTDLDAAEQQFKQQGQAPSSSDAEAGGVEPTYNPPASAAVYATDPRGEQRGEQPVPVYGSFDVFAEQSENKADERGGAKAEGHVTAPVPTSIDPDID